MKITWRFYAFFLIGLVNLGLGLYGLLTKNKKQPKSVGILLLVLVVGIIYIIAAIFAFYLPYR